MLLSRISRLLALLGVVAALGLCQAAAQSPPADGSRRILLGSLSIAAGGPTGRLTVDRRIGRIQALQLVPMAEGVLARGGNIAVRRAVVSYTNGQTHFWDRGEPFILAAGTPSGDIDRRLEERYVASVEISLDARRAVARFEVWAFQSAAEAAAMDERRRREQDGGRIAARGVDEPAAAPPPGAARPPVPGDARIGEPPAAAAQCARNVCAEVPVFFGTNRAIEQVTGPPQQARRLTFAPKAATPQALTLGRAVVTIPTGGRTRGAWSRPEFDWLVARLRYRSDDLARDFTLLSVDRFDEANFLTAARDRLGRAQARPGHVLLFVHGYNVSFDDAMFRAAQIAYDAEFDGAVLAFSWPSNGSLLGYNVDKDRASASRDVLRDFLGVVSRIRGATHVHVVTHSMGTHPLLGALSDLVQWSAAPLRLQELVVAAPDMARDSFEAHTARIARTVAGITLYASSNDRALQASGIAHLRENPVGLVVAGTPPAIVPGVTTIDVSAASTGFFALNHSSYAERQVLVEDLGRLIATGVREPDRRTPSLKSRKVPPDKVYWQYEAR